MREKILACVLCVVGMSACFAYQHNHPGPSDPEVVKIVNQGNDKPDMMHKHDQQVIKETVRVIADMQNGDQTLREIRVSGIEVGFKQ